MSGACVYLKNKEPCLLSVFISSFVHPRRSPPKAFAMNAFLKFCHNLYNTAVASFLFALCLTIAYDFWLDERRTVIHTIAMGIFSGLAVVSFYVSWSFSQRVTDDLCDLFQRSSPTPKTLATIVLEVVEDSQTTVLEVIKQVDEHQQTRKQVPGELAQHVEAQIPEVV
jgi:hypothetical protein